MARKFVCAYYTWLDSLKKCTDEEFGRLVRAALKYARDGDAPSFAEGSKEDTVWGLLQAQLDADRQKYIATSAGGTKGMRNRWGKRDPSQDEVKTAGTGQTEIADLRKFIDSMSGTSSN